MSGEHDDGFKLFSDDELARLRREQLRGGGHEGIDAEELQKQLRRYAQDAELFALAEATGLEVADLSEEVPADVIGRVPKAFAETYRVLPVDYDRQTGELVVALADPREQGAVLDDLSFMLNLEVRGALADADALDAAIARYYGAPSQKNTGDEGFQRALEQAGFTPTPEARAKQRERIKGMVERARGRLSEPKKEKVRLAAVRKAKLEAQRPGEARDFLELLEDALRREVAEEQPLSAGYLLMAAVDGELTAEEGARLEDRLADADAVVRLEWDWLQRVSRRAATLALAPVPEDRFDGFLAQVEARIDEVGPEVAGASHRSARPPALTILREPGGAAAPNEPAADLPRCRVGSVGPDSRGLGLEAFAITQPSARDAGDFFDLLPDDGGLHVAIGDASGADAKARSAADTCKAYLRALARAGLPLDEVMAQANRMLMDDLDRASFVSALALRWDEASARLTWCGAGHEHLIHYRASSREAVAIKAGGVVLGVVSKPGRTYQVQELALEPGDRLLLYSDGVVELEPCPLLPDDFCQWVAEHGALDPATLAKSLIQHSHELGGGQPLRDDATVVVLARSPRT